MRSFTRCLAFKAEGGFMVEYGSLSRDCDVLWLAKPSNPSISEKAARLAACMWLRQTSMLIEPHIFFENWLDKSSEDKICKRTLCEFTGSGWGLWFSSRKWMLYKLGTQENLATDIKPIRGILEKWQLTGSAFSKLCIGFFLRKTSPYLNCIVVKSRNQF
jgi:hypothetical protein